MIIIAQMNEKEKRKFLFPGKTSTNLLMRPWYHDSIRQPMLHPQAIEASVANKKGVFYL